MVKHTGAMARPYAWWKLSVSLAATFATALPWHGMPSYSLSASSAYFILYTHKKRPLAEAFLTYSRKAG